MTTFLFVVCCTTEDDGTSHEGISSIIEMILHRKGSPLALALASPRSACPSMAIQLANTWDARRAGYGI